LFCLVFSITLDTVRYKINLASLEKEILTVKMMFLSWLRLCWVEEKCDFARERENDDIFVNHCRVSFLLPTSFSLSLQLFYLCQDINSQKNKTSVVSGFQIQLSLALRCQAYLLFLLHPSSTVTSLSLSFFLLLFLSLLEFLSPPTWDVPYFSKGSSNNLCTLLLVVVHNLWGRDAPSPTLPLFLEA